MKKTLLTLLIVGLLLGGLDIAREARAASLALQDDTDAPPQTDRLGIEGPDLFARAELTFFQTLHGVVLGLEACVLLDCGDSIRLRVGTLLAGGGAGLAASLLTTGDGITPGHALLIDSATGWGFWNALALNFVLDNWRDDRASTGLMMAGQLGGLGAGVYLWDAFRPQAGDVSLVNSAGVWSGILTIFAFEAFDLTLRDREAFGTLLATTNLGGLAGATWAQDHPMGRGRVFVINASGVVGALLGFGTAALVAGEDVSDEAMFGSGIAGTLAGLGLGAYLTQGWQLELPEEQEQVSLTSEGIAFTVVSFKF